MALYDPNEFPVEAPAINEVADKLARSRELIERGWCQHHFINGSNVCSLGAILKAYNPEFNDFSILPKLSTNRAIAVLKVALGVSEITGLEDDSVVAWNDTPGRTQAEVVEAFRKAEAIARGETA